jgi:peptidoglycan hydrolase-like protein with peptidoglycan-binding domain
MCVEKTRAYVKDNKLKLLNGIVGWGRPVYIGEENLPLLSKVGSSDSPVAKAPAAKKPAAPKAPAAFTPFKKGAKGPKVKKVQTVLKLKVDGDFGAVTEKAVIAFQKANGFEANGTVGPKTWDAIVKLGGK